MNAPAKAALDETAEADAEQKERSWKTFRKYAKKLWDSYVDYRNGRY